MSGRNGKSSNLANTVLRSPPMGLARRIARKKVSRGTQTVVEEGEQQQARFMSRGTQTGQVWTADSDPLAPMVPARECMTTLSTQSSRGTDCLAAEIALGIGGGILETIDSVESNGLTPGYNVEKEGTNVDSQDDLIDLSLDFDPDGISTSTSVQLEKASRVTITPGKPTLVQLVPKKQAPGTVINTDSLLQNEPVTPSVTCRVGQSISVCRDVTYQHGDAQRSPRSIDSDPNTCT